MSGVRRAALLVGAVLAVVGPLLPLYRQVPAFATQVLTTRTTLWGVESSERGQAL